MRWPPPAGIDYIGDFPSATVTGIWSREIAEVITSQGIRLQPGSSAEGELAPPIGQDYLGSQIFSVGPEPDRLRHLSSPRARTISAGRRERPFAVSSQRTPASSS